MDTWVLEMSYKIVNWQKARIKMLQKSLGIDDASYRDTLGSYGVKSCTALSYEAANNLIKKLESMQVEPIKAKRQYKKKYSELEGLPERDGLVSPAQLRYLEGLWKSVSRKKDSPKARNEALDAFCIKHVGFGLLKLDFVEMRKMIRTVESMKKG